MWSTGFVRSLRNAISRPRAGRTVFVQFHSSYERCSYLMASVQLAAFVCSSVGAYDACGAGSHPGDCAIAKRTRAETGLGLGRRTQGALRSAVLPFYSSSMVQSGWLVLLSMCCTCLSACECLGQHSWQSSVVSWLPPLLLCMYTSHPSLPLHVMVACCV